MVMSYENGDYDVLQLLGEMVINDNLNLLQTEMTNIMLFRNMGMNDNRKSNRYHNNVKQLVQRNSLNQNE